MKRRTPNPRDTEPCLYCGEDPEECRCLDRVPEPQDEVEKDDNA